MREVALFFIFFMRIGDTHRGEREREREKNFARLSTFTAKKKSDINEFLLLTISY